MAIARLTDPKSHAAEALIWLLIFAALSAVFIAATFGIYSREADDANVIALLSYHKSVETETEEAAAAHDRIENAKRKLRAGGYITTNEREHLLADILNITRVYISANHGAIRGQCDAPRDKIDSAEAEELNTICKTLDRLSERLPALRNEALDVVAAAGYPMVVAPMTKDQTAVLPNDFKYKNGSHVFQDDSPGFEAIR